MPDAALIEDLTAIVLAAGEAVMAIHRSDFAVDHKADASPVTRADTEAEAIILAGLARLAPEIPVVAEEATAAGATVAAAPRFFLVDPLDGTREFVSRNGEFTVNVALVENGEPILGLVLAPALGRLWRGGRGLGAERLDLADGTRRKITTRPAPADGLVAVASRSHADAETDLWLSRLPIAARIAAGSSLKLCLVAEGSADVYPRFGRTMAWDIAAGDAVLRAAGGLVTTLDGAPLTYGRRAADGAPDRANPPFVAWGDPRASAVRH